MDLRLPEDLERLVTSQVQSGRLASSQEAIAEAVRLLQRQEEVEEGIRQGLDDMRAGRGRPADDVFAETRRDFDL